MADHRKFIFVCTGSDCKKSGCKELTKELKRLINNEENKGQYKIVKTKCMDFCKTGPVVVMDQKILKKAKKEQLPRFLK
ncbi:(2Fe-2S) ferredoxin domain-containing protein [Pararhodonellum marinum]|uniref:(2Fe-2S) ferredoxin domain-containing protein n=1 Tax=Pararhodonellum marinum TaxID=2755358 RepID=UPI00188F5986|nr:(2Fe-2S) ferredoxin domain-containing protein [Pararhodonellum marinum]